MNYPTGIAIYAKVSAEQQQILSHEALEFVAGPAERKMRINGLNCGRWDYICQLSVVSASS